MSSQDRTRSRTRAFAPRDQNLSPFGVILARLCDALGAHGAVLVDQEGEAVDYAGTTQPFDLKVGGAELRLLINCFGASFFGGSADCELVLKSRKKSFAAFALDDGYALVVRLPLGAFHTSRRAVSEAVRDLCEEAGWRVPASFAKDRWVRVDVRVCSGAPRRPEALWIDGRWHAVEVLGRWVDQQQLLAREDGYRVRLGNGSELTLVRERFGRWFAEEPPQSAGGVGSKPLFAR